MFFYLIKWLHVVTAIISISGFFLRGIWMIQASQMLTQKWVKILPHVIDTLLLASAMILIFYINQYPFSHGWLSAKLIGLMVYIGLGLVALRFGKTRTIKITAWFAAMGTFSYIIAVAITKNPWIIS